MPSPGSCLPWGLGHPRVGSPAWTPDLVCRGASPPGAYSPCSEPFLGASQDPQPVAAEPSPLLPGPALGCTLAAPTSCTSAHWKPSPVPLQAPREHVPATATPATRMLKEGMGLPGALHCPLRPVGELGLLSRAPQSPVFESPPRPPPLLCGPEIACEQKARAVTGLASFVSLLAGITVLPCSLSAVLLHFP